MSLPSGIHSKPRPRTPAQGKRLNSNDRIKTLTKLKLQEYIESFFSKIGENNDLLGVVSPRSLSYNIERSFDAKTDPTERKMQIARYFNELRGIVPAILILDSGIEAVPQSIGQISSSYIDQGNWFGFFPIFRKVPVTIIVSARDQETTDDLCGLMSLMFNELRNLAGGNFITGDFEQGETWVITLPNGPVQIGSVIGIDIENDPLEKIFYAESTMEIFYEDVVSVKEQLPTIDPGGIKVGEPNLAGDLKPLIEIADTIPLNAQTLLYIQNFQQHHRIQLSDSSKATLSPTMILTPRNFGPFKIQVYDSRIPELDKQIVAEKTVTVV